VANRLIYGIDFFLLANRSFYGIAIFFLLAKLNKNGRPLGEGEGGGGREVAAEVIGEAPVISPQFSNV
jgi:hypothetical protein